VPSGGRYSLGSSGSSSSLASEAMFACKMDWFRRPRVTLVDVLGAEGWGGADVPLVVA
jgi:hypothetical protein